MPGYFLNLDSRLDAAQIVERLKKERDTIVQTGSCHLTGLGLDGVQIDEPILQAVVDLLRSAFVVVVGGVARKDYAKHQKEAQVAMTQLSVCNCPANPFLEYVMEVAMGMDLFREIELAGSLNATTGAEDATGAPAAVMGNNPENDDHGDGEQNSDDDQEGDEGRTNNNDDDVDDLPTTNPAFGFRMRFLRRLYKLQLIQLSLSRDEVESLMYGMETSGRQNRNERGGIEHLSLEGIRFETDDDGEGDDDPIEELCEGLPRIASLRTLEIRRCQLTDVQLQKLIDSIRRHPTLKVLTLAENHCRERGLQAIDRLLTGVPNENNDDNDGLEGALSVCVLESLNLSYQFTSEDAFAMTSEQMQLDILTGDWPTKINRTLLKLDLSGNQLQDSDMQHMALLLRRFPCLKELDLRFNDITTEGLDIFSTRIENHDTSTTEYVAKHRPSMLRIVRLTNNPLTSANFPGVLVRLLKNLPELQFVQSNIVWEHEDNKTEIRPGGVQAGGRICDDIQHLMDINHAGRVLLSHRRRSIGLSVWPTVLARLTRPSQYPHFVPMQNKFNGIFYLLRYGPLLMKPNGASDRPHRSDTSVPDRATRKRKRGDPALGGHSTLADFLRFEAGVEA